jgi:hypothetical protein
VKRAATLFEMRAFMFVLWTGVCWCIRPSWHSCKLVSVAARMSSGRQRKGLCPQSLGVRVTRYSGATWFRNISPYLSRWILGQYPKQATTASTCTFTYPPFVIIFLPRSTLYVVWFIGLIQTRSLHNPGVIRYVFVCKRRLELAVACSQMCSFCIFGNNRT